MNHMELKKIYNRPTITVFETQIECPLLDSSQDDHADSKQQRFVFEEEESRSGHSIWVSNTVIVGLLYIFFSSM